MFEITNEVTHEINEKNVTLVFFIKKITGEDHADNVLEQYTNDHPNAAHISYARRVLKLNGQIYIKRSDGGEPTGTSGAPMLAHLVEENLVNTLIIATRSAGKTNPSASTLGALYKKGAAAALNKAGKSPYTEKAPFVIAVPLNKGNQLLTLLADNAFPVSDKQYTHELTVTVQCPVDRKEELEGIIKRVLGVVK